MNPEKMSRKEKNQNIQVFVRLRPINNRERELKSLGVVEVSGLREVLVKQSPIESKITKKFTFDRAFGPNSKQVDVYQEVVSPLIEEVLAGYNCTVFAYGQTGTGKTHTMVGESSINGEVSWQNDPMAGIIPRSLSQLFDELRVTNSEFTVRVSYLELYNEELFDLLSSSEDNSKLRIYEDVTRKGSNIVNGLEEVTVYNKNEVYKIMAKGQEKRKIASTLMNAQSSRSHTVFTIVVHMKENSSEGEELMKIGKLNLVDLAGSENISKAGSDNPARKERARECVNINQSLLTLGRVITSLVERHPHIPYRESKLTRLLQESLGGRTKTSIIATISPGHRDVEETLSTLEYANRARCIQNKPEVNQRITKHAVLKEYSEEIDRLKRDLLAARERNGVYISMDTYTDMNLKMEEQTKEIQEQLLYIRAMKEEKDRIQGLFTEMEDNLRTREEQLEKTNANLANTKNVLKNTEQVLVESREECDEQKHLVTKQVDTEVQLSQQAKELLNVADTTTQDLTHLHNTVDKKRALEDTNLQKVKGFGEKSQTLRSQMQSCLHTFTDTQLQQLQTLQATIDSQHLTNMERQQSSKQLISAIFLRLGDIVQSSEQTSIECSSSVQTLCDNKFKELRTASEDHNVTSQTQFSAIADLLTRLEAERQRERDSVQQMTQFIQQWKDAFVAKLVNLRRVQSEWWGEVSAHLLEIGKIQAESEEAVASKGREAQALRQKQQQDLSQGLREMRYMLESLESQAAASSVALDEVETARQTAADDGARGLRKLLETGVENLQSRTTQQERALTLLDDSNKSFLQDIAKMNAGQIERMDQTQEIDQELKKSVSNLSNHCTGTWTSTVVAIDNVKLEVEQKCKEAIQTQQTTYVELVQSCQSQSPAVTVLFDGFDEILHQQHDDNAKWVDATQGTVKTFSGQMEDNLSTKHTIENKFLNEEYRLYSPTGKTPNRRDFMYPRELAATSPHERILRRFRNLRNGISSPQCVQVIDLDQTIEGTPMKKKVSDASSVESGDSGTASPSEQLQASNVNLSVPPLRRRSRSPSLERQFLEPKAPTSLKSTPAHLFKCTSESDIYNLVNTNSQSKENLNRSENDKKEFRSRLRQPNSQKKVLGNRNC